MHMTLWFMPAASENSSSDACIIIEAAKTGRSKCRRCLEMLEAGALRVGMESWMVGRQVTVWQHPKCMLAGLQVTEEASGTWPFESGASIQPAWQPKTPNESRSQWRTQWGSEREGNRRLLEY